MKIEKEFRDDHQVKLTVEIDSEPFEIAKRRAARQVAKRVKIPGFRPGKAPYGVILRQVGEGHIVEEALEILIEEQYPEIIKEAEIKPYGPGKLEGVPQLDPPTFEFIVPLEAEVELGDYKSLRIPYEIPQISDKDLEDNIENIRDQNASRESVERPAELGDIVFMRISGINLDIENEAEATIIEERFSSSLIQETEDENEWPFPGFSKELIGISIDDEKTLTYKYPDDYNDESLQGINAELKIFVTNIQTKNLPEIDEEFVKKVSEFESVEEWKINLKENLAEQSIAEYNENYENQIIDEIITQSSIKYPPQIIEREKEIILNGLEYRLSQQGLNKELYLQIRGLDEDGLNEEITPIAEERIQRSLVLMEIAKSEEIKADPGEVEVEMGKTVQAISSTMTPNEAKKFASSDYIPSLATNIVADMVTQSTIKYLLATAKGETWLSEENKTSEDHEVEAVESHQLDVDTSPVSEQSEQVIDINLKSVDESLTVSEPDISSSEEINQENAEITSEDND